MLFAIFVLNLSIIKISGLSFILLKPVSLLASFLVIAPGLDYDKFSKSYDYVNSNTLTKVLGIEKLRSMIGNAVEGDTLEIGVGTGLQLPYYQYNKMKSYTGIDSSVGMINKAIEKSKMLHQSNNFILMNADELNFSDNKFDSVIDTFSMCVYDNPLKVLNEMKRIIKPNGKIFLIENTVSTNSGLRNVQNILEPVITPMSKGCKWNIDIPEIVNTVGLNELERKDFQFGTLIYGVYSKK